MKRTHCLSLVLLLAWPCAEIFGQPTGNDLLPLQAGRTWSYQYNSRERYGFLGIYRWQKTSSGSLRFRVLRDSTDAMNIYWKVESVESLSVHYEDLYPFPGDTTYATASRDTFAVAEELSGNHLLVSDSCSAPWLFPRRWYSPYYGAIAGTDSAVYRYSPGQTADTLYSSSSSYPVTTRDTIILARNMGVTWNAGSIVRGPNSPYEYYWDATLLGRPTAVMPGGGGLIPDGFALLPCHPNPFNPSTVVSYQLPVAGKVRLVVLDMLGREVAVLTDGMREAGIHDVTFTASGLSSGM